MTSVSLVVAVPAVAATGLWKPLLGNPSVDGSAPGVARTTIPQQQRDMLSVLRQPQSEQDRSAASLGLLTPLAPVTDGVRLQDVRLMTDDRDAADVALVPVERLYKTSPNDGGQLLAEDALCLTDKSNIVCATTAQVRAGALSTEEGNFYYGLVPDGVATVRINFANGTSRSLAVHHNFFGATFDRIPWTPERSYTLALQREPMEMAAGADATTTWLDAQGREITR